LQMATLNAARALRQEGSLGRIRPGSLADLIGVPCERSTTVFEEIIAADKPHWSILDGKIA
jgi:imidazolonepropionase-like amidohydrolase